MLLVALNSGLLIFNIHVRNMAPYLLILLPSCSDSSLTVLECALEEIMDKVDDNDIYNFRVRREHILNDCIGNVSTT